MYQNNCKKFMLKSAVFLHLLNKYPTYQHLLDNNATFLKKWKNGAQVVVGIRNSNEKEGFIKKWGSKAFYKLFNSVSGAEIKPRESLLRLLCWSAFLWRF